MWQRFTERARKTVFFAQEEAGKLGKNYVSTEHLLLGLIREGDTVAARVLDRLGVSRGRIRADLERQVARGDGRLSQDMQLTPRAKRVIDLAYDEARQLGNNYIGTEHLLLGLLREAEGMAGKTLIKLGVELERTRMEVKQLQELGKGQIEENTPSKVQSGSEVTPASEVTLASEPKLAAFAEAVTQFVQSYQDQTLAAASYYGQTDNAIQHQIQEKTASQRMAPTPEGRSDLSGILSETRLRGRDILGIEELTQEEILLVLDVAARLKTHKFDDTQTQFAKGQSLAMLFEKPSLRTRVTFEAGMTQLGGHAIYLEGRLGIRETVPDVAKNLDRWIDGIMARTFDHQTVRDLAENADIPVINGLSDREHPCQAFADFQTLAERKGNLSGLTLAYIGDGNNVAHSLMLLAAKVGTHFRLACPEGYEPDKELWATALRFADISGAILTLTHDPITGVRDADAVYTDVWASMGQEEETAERAIIFGIGRAHV